MLMSEYQPLRLESLEFLNSSINRCRILALLPNLRTLDLSTCSLVSSSLSPVYLHQLTTLVIDLRTWRDVEIMCQLLTNQSTVHHLSLAHQIDLCDATLATSFSTALKSASLQLISLILTVKEDCPRNPLDRLITSSYITSFITRFDAAPYSSHPS